MYIDICERLKSKGRKEGIDNDVMAYSALLFKLNAQELEMRLNNSKKNT